MNGLPPREEMTLASVIKKLAPALKKMRENGYSVDECAAELSARGVQVAGRTLARLMGSGKTAKRRVASRT